jgi:hypothetical protein
MGRAIIITAIIAAATGTAVVLLPRQGHGAEVRAGAEAGEEHEGTRMIRGATCGIERWPVKTLSDPAARRVDFAVRPATVRYLGSLRANTGGQDSRAPLEMRVFGVQARLVGVKREPDSDYHLILSEGGATMIAEMPLTACTSGAQHRYAMSTARALERARRPGRGSPDPPGRRRRPFRPAGQRGTREHWSCTVTVSRFPTGSGDCCWLKPG